MTTVVAAAGPLDDNHCAKHCSDMQETLLTTTQPGGPHLTGRGPPAGSCQVGLVETPCLSAFILSLSLSLRHTHRRVPDKAKVQQSAKATFAGTATCQGTPDTGLASCEGAAEAEKEAGDGPPLARLPPGSAPLSSLVRKAGYQLWPRAYQGSSSFWEMEEVRRQG